MWLMEMYYGDITSGDTWKKKVSSCIVPPWSEKKVLLKHLNIVVLVMCSLGVFFVHMLHLQYILPSIIVNELSCFNASLKLKGLVEQSHKEILSFNQFFSSSGFNRPDCIATTKIQCVLT